MECKQFNFQYTVCVLNKVILNTINHPRRGAQRKTSLLCSRTYVAVFHQHSISLVQVWLASLFTRSSRSPSLLELYVRPNLSSLLLIHSVSSHLIRRRASELDQNSLEFYAKCRSFTCSLSCKLNCLFSSVSRLSRKTAKNYRSVTAFLLRDR